jgi:hypothetical protein
MFLVKKNMVSPSNISSGTVGIGLALTVAAFLALTGLDAAVDGVERTACASHLSFFRGEVGNLLGIWR